MTTTPAPRPRSSALRDIGLVYQREVTARLSSKGYFAGMLIMTVAVVAIIMGLSSMGSPKTLQVAVCGADTAEFGTPPEGVRMRACSGIAQARTATADEDTDAAVVIEDGRVTLLVRGDGDQQARDAAAALGRTWALNQAYQDQGVDRDRLTRQLSTAAPRVETIGDGVDGKQLGAAVSLVIILFMQIVGQGSLIAQGVVEEKSTRIVEVLLATLTPLRLMAGKVAGIGTAAVLQILVLVGALVGARAAAGGGSGVVPGAGAVLSLLVWFLLSFALFAGLFAAAGSLVSRPEDLQSVLMPVMILALLPVGVAAVAANDLSAPWVEVVQYLPPFSGVLMPLKASVGAVSPLEQLLAATVMLLAAAACMWLASRIYQASVLKIGATVRWRQALAA
ncbi:ABC transporter permease [Streptomyces sp. ISL-43]|uniref:ABC transporter permease n=1 Tax=Streptomyces sp. ISL-43 TaxID=2819183 RepID=UPI001BE50C49|nr:ABC transporter permease [Streptomyces sp. ISL-43]MBT2446161.1 ABC transporter permease [Streptomyces sp. ISL-43]